MTDESIGGSETAAEQRVRVDWRTGQPMVQRDEAFWREHEQRRQEQGLNVPQYCATNGLALSTYRHRVYGKRRSGATSQGSKPAPSPPSFLAMPVTRPDAPAFVEVVLAGMTLRLGGEAAERVLSGVLARLA